VGQLILCIFSLEYKELCIMVSKPPLLRVNRVNGRLIHVCMSYKLL
jgi:hypothetical protein